MTKTPVRATRAKTKPAAKATRAKAVAAKPAKAKKAKAVPVKKSVPVKPAPAKTPPAKATLAKPAPAKAVATKGKPAAAPAKPAGKTYPDAKGVLKVILAQAEDMKAEDTITIDLKGTASEVDYVVVTTGRSNRHVGSIADRVVEGLRAAGVRAKVEGMANCDWVLIDAGDAIVHVFRPEVRTFYNLEKMWAGTAGPRRAS